MSYKYLPSDSWKYSQSLYNSFNNDLIRGHNQGLELHNYNSDLNLYKPLEFKPLDSVSFDDINKKLDENNNIYNNVKSGISGILDGTGKGLNNFISSSLGIDSINIKTYIGLFLLFLLIYKKF